MENFVVIVAYTSVCVLTGVWIGVRHATRVFESEPAPAPRCRHVYTEEDAAREREAVSRMNFDPPP